MQTVNRLHNFRHSGTPAIGCSFKAAAGLLYPLERGFIYVHKPPIHIRFEEIASVNFARGGGSTRSFDFEVELKSGTVHTFSSIEKEEYAKLFDFITSKKLNIKNRGKNVSRSVFELLRSFIFKFFRTKHLIKMTLEILMMRLHQMPIWKELKQKHRKEMMVKVMTMMKVLMKILTPTKMKVMLLKNLIVNIAAHLKMMKKEVAQVSF